MMQFIECSGDSRAVGRAHGEAMRSLIRERWETQVGPYMEKLIGDDAAMRAHIEWIHVATRRYLKSSFPDILEEMYGIGEGAGLTNDQSLILHTYNALLTPKRIDVAPPPGSDGCTAIAFGDSPAGPFLFKTYDPFGSPQIDTPEKFASKCEEENRWCFVMRAKYAEAQGNVDTLSVRMAGSSWVEACVNDRGLGFGAASLHPRLYPQSAATLPQHCLSTVMVKRCGSVAQVRAMLPQIPVFGKGTATAYVDVLGQTVGAEKTGNFTGLNAPQLGVAFQTNHIRSEALVGEAIKQDPEFFQNGYFKNSAKRVRRIEHSIARWTAITDFDFLVDDLYKTGACGDMVQNCTPMNHHWITTWSALVLVEQRELRITDGPPAQKKFGTWRLT